MLEAHPGAALLVCGDRAIRLANEASPEPVLHPAVMMASVSHTWCGVLSVPREAVSLELPPRRPRRGAVGPTQPTGCTNDAA